MKSQRIGMALLLLGLVGLGSCDATQPKPQCKTQPADFAARYDLKSMEGMCDGKTPGGEVLHMQYYIPDRQKPNDTPSVAIEPVSIADAFDAEMPMTAPTGTEFSLAKFATALPGDDDICSAAAFDGETKVAGDVNLTYEWSNLKSLVTAESNGFYFAADLTRTEDDCKAAYKVTAIYPVLPCGSMIDPMSGNNVSEGDPDDSVCKNGSVDKQINLSPQLDYYCEPDSLVCVTKNAFPARRK